MIGFLKYVLMFTMSGSIYYVLEVFWRGRSHVAMIFVGGLCFLAIGLINDFSCSHGIRFLLQILLSVTAIIAIEFASGVYLNLYLGLNIWNYGTLPYNLKGQVCLYFGLLWIPISVAAIELDNLMKTLLFGLERTGILQSFLRR